jgi:hypothetical protein
VLRDQDGVADEHECHVVRPTYFGHYRGFARQQEAEAITSPTAKKILYVLRTALTGAHLLRTGELRVALNENLDEYDDARELLEKKKAGERTVLDEASFKRWQSRVQRAFQWLEDAHAKSALPDERRTSKLSRNG